MLNKSIFLKGEGNLFSRSGDYEIHIEAKNKLDYYAFLPRLLCEGININIDQELCGLLSNAHRLLGILEGMSLYLLNIEDIEQMFIKKEAYMSCRIDGSTIPFERIFGQEKSICKDLEKIPVCA